MIDVSNLSEELLFNISVLYDFSASESEKNTLEKSVRGQRKLRKLVKKLYNTRHDELPDEIRSFIEKESDADVLSFLKNCSCRYNDLISEKKNSLCDQLSFLDENSRSTLIQMFYSFGYWPVTELLDKDIRMYFEETTTYIKQLTLKNVKNFVPALVGASVENCSIVFNREEKRYCICGKAETFSGDGLIDVNVSFDDAEVELSIVNPCCDNISFENPWDYLGVLSDSICAKSDIHREYLNEKEKSLIPLLRDIVEIEYPNFESEEVPSFNELESLFKQYDCGEAIKLLHKFKVLRLENRSVHKLYKTFRKLVNLLSKKKYEPIWREVFEKIKESQKEYPSKVEMLCDRNLLNDTRAEIQKLMKDKGYEGTYPDFIKQGKINNVRLAQAYNTTYFVGFEKNVKHFVHCVELFEGNGTLTIQFLCGASLLKKDGDEKDVFGCMFDAKGRRFFSVLQHHIPLDREYDGEMCDVARAVAAAVKKAELLKLNKAERNDYNEYHISEFKYFMWLFVTFGGIFGIGLTLTSMLVAGGFTYIVGDLADVWDVLKTFPWWQCLTVGWIGYGGAQGIVETLVRRK